MELDEVVNMLELEDAISRNMNELSGGELQRVAIAATIMTQPWAKQGAEFLLRDLPGTGNLGATGQQFQNARHPAPALAGRVLRLRNLHRERRAAPSCQCRAKEAAPTQPARVSAARKAIAATMKGSIRAANARRKPSSSKCGGRSKRVRRANRTISARVHDAAAVKAQRRCGVARDQRVVVGGDHDGRTIPV